LKSWADPNTLQGADSERSIKERVIVAGILFLTCADQEDGLA